MKDGAETSMGVPPGPGEQAAVDEELRKPPDSTATADAAGAPAPAPGPDTTTTDAALAPPLLGADGATSTEPVLAPQPTDAGIATALAAPPASDGPAAGPAAEAELECPQCGLVLVGEAPRPTAAWFCPRCDFPVFWASPPPPVAPGQSRARRRLPGTAGTDVLGAEPCWKCGEMNGPDNGACVRCLAPLPRPVEHVREVEVVVPTPIPVPYVFETVSWPFVLAGLFAGAAIGIVVTLWLTGQLALPIGPEAAAMVPALAGLRGRTSRWLGQLGESGEDEAAPEARVSSRRRARALRGRW